MNNLLCLLSLFFLSHVCVRSSLLSIACALRIRTAILPTKGTRWKRGKPAGGVPRPCEMGWHPIVYTLLSTPAFPRARCARASDLQGRSTLSLFSEQWRRRKRKWRRGPVFSKEGDKMHARVFLCALGSRRVGSLVQLLSKLLRKMRMLTGPRRPTRFPFFLLQGT